MALSAEEFERISVPATISGLTQQLRVEHSRRRLAVGQMRLVLSKLDQGEAFPGAWESACQCRTENPDHLPDNLQDGIDGYDVCAGCFKVFPLDELFSVLTTGFRICLEHKKFLQDDPEALTQGWLRSRIQRHMRKDKLRLSRVSTGHITGTDRGDTPASEAAGLIRDCWMTEREALRDAYTGRPLHSLLEYTKGVHGAANSK